MTQIPENAIKCYKKAVKIAPVFNNPSFCLIKS